MKKINILLILCVLIVFVSCGKESKNDSQPRNDEIQNVIHTDENFFDKERLRFRSWYDSAIRIHPEMVYPASEWFDNDGNFVIPLDIETFENRIIYDSNEVMAVTTIPLEIIDEIETKDILEMVKFCIKIEMFPRFFYGDDETYYTIFTGNFQAADLLQYRDDAKKLIQEDYDKNQEEYDEMRKEAWFDLPNEETSVENVHRRNRIQGILAYEKVYLETVE